MENRTRRPAHGDVVDGDTVSTIGRNRIDFAVSGEVHLCNRRRVLEFPGIDLELVECFDCRLASVNHFSGTFFFGIALGVFTDNFDESPVNVELSLDVGVLVGEQLNRAVTAHVAKGALAFLALLNGDCCFTLEFGELGERAVAVVVGFFVLGSKQNVA